MRTSFRSLFTAMLLVCGAASAHAQNVSVVGTVDRRDQIGSAGRDGDGRRISTPAASSRAVTDVKGEYRLLNVPAGNYKLQAELSGFATVVLARVELLVGQNATIPFYIEDRAGQRNAHGARRVAARRHVVVTGRGQRRSPADGGAAAPGPQLDGAVEAREGDHGERRREHARRQPGRRLSAEPRRAADHAEGRRVGVRPAEVQPRGDRRIPDRHQHVRHHAGPLVGHPGAGDLAIRHEQHWRAASTASSATTSSTRPTRWPTGCCRTRTSRSAVRSAGRS